MKNNKYFYFLFLSLILLISACKKDTQILNPPSEIPCQATADEQKIIDALQNSFAYSFDDTNPETNDEKLTPLLDYLQSAKIVGLGEATHGTKEFYHMKDKIFRSLVTKKGFKAIIFEIPWGNAKVVNDFVIDGKGDAESAINQTVYWTYDTQEIRDLAQWIHDYNLTQSADDKVFFVGCDPQGSDFQNEKRIVFNYLFDIYPDSNSFLTNNYINLPSDDLPDYWKRLNSIHESNIKGTKTVLDYFISNEAELIERSSPFEYEVAKMAAHVIQQRERIYRIRQFGTPRDSLMAVYSEWWRQILGQDAKVAVWAHNLHVMDGDAFGSNFMGTFLRNNDPTGYKNVGFSFGKGSLNAFVADSDRSFLSGIEKQTLPNLVCPSTNFILSQVEGEHQYYIFEEFTGTAQSYFNDPNPFIQCGAGFNPKFISNYTQNFPISKTLDVLIHFDETEESQLR